MAGSFIFLSLFLIFITSSGVKSQDPAWVASTDTLDVRFCSSMIIDEDNNIYIAAQGHNYVTLLKYDKWGVVKYAENDGIHGTHGKMCWGNDSRIYLAGSRRFELYNSDATIVVFGSDGTHAFTLSYDFMGMYDIYNDIYVDDNNYIYACGNGYNEEFDGYGIVARYRPDGSLDWINTYGFPQKDVTLLFLNVDSNGNVYASGRISDNMPGNMELVSLKYSVDGHLIHEYSDTFNNYTSYTTRFSLIDSDGSIYMGGKVNEDINYFAFLLKIQDGHLMWSKEFPDWIGLSDFHDATFNQDGNIICCGRFTDHETDSYLVEISPDGDLIKETLYSNIPNQGELFFGVAEKSGYYYCCGQVEAQGIATIAMFNSEFELMWETNYNTPVIGHDKVDLIALDYEDNVIVSGYTATSEYSCLILKYSDPLYIYDQEHTGMVHMEIFPNPAMSFIANQEVSTGEFKILNMAGEEVLNGILNHSRIDVTPLPKGIYFIHIYESGTQYYAKFVKQ